MYAIIKRGKKVFHIPSRQLKLFQKQITTYFFAMPRSLIARIPDQPLLIECYFYFPVSRLYTKKHTIKKLDVSNRLKALHDCLCKVIGIDDSQFFEIYAIKIPHEVKECVDVKISTID
jgi:Holliday junction resolvase RusA-like endonuclease